MIIFLIKTIEIMFLNWKMVLVLFDLQTLQ